MEDHEKAELEALRVEVSGLFNYVNRVREEIAAIHQPADAEHHLPSMGEQLDAIVESTEAATHSIIEAVEDSQLIIKQLQDSLTEEQRAALAKVIGNGTRIFEACSFQDITGQRVAKVMKSIVYVEERVNALVDIWGSEDIAKIGLRESSKTTDEKLLQGPQLKGRGISQAEIDALFE